MDENNVVIASLEINVSELVKQAGETKKTLDQLKETQKQMKKDNDTSSESFVNNEVAIKKATKAYNDQLKEINNLASTVEAQAKREEMLNLVLDQEVVSIAEARAQNALLNKLRNEANLTTAEGVAEVSRLNEQLDRNNKFITDNLDKLAKQRNNVGNYADSIIDAYKALDEQRKALEENKKSLIAVMDQTDKNSDTYNILNQQLNQLNVQINIVSDSMDQAAGQTTGFKNNLDLLSSSTNNLTGGLMNLITVTEQTGSVNAAISQSFKGMISGVVGLTKAGIAFIATPLGATMAVLAAVVGSLVAIFKVGSAEMGKTSEGTAKLNSAFAKLNSIFGPIIKLGKQFLTDVLGALIDAFEWAYDKALAFNDAMADLAKFFGMDAIGDSIQGITDGIRKSSEEQDKLNKLAQEFDAEQRKARLTQLEYQKDAERLRQIRDNSELSFSERQNANLQLGELLKKQQQEELRIQEINLARIEQEIKMKGNLTELDNQRIDALTAIADIQERITGQESEQKSNANALRKEEADLAKQRSDKAKQAEKQRLNDARNQLQEELNLFLAKSGLAAKTEAERQAIEEQAHKKRLKLIQAEYNASEKKEADKLKLQAATEAEMNSFAMFEIEMVQSVADRELEINAEKNRKKLTDNKFVSEQVYKDELQRLQDLENAEYANLALRLSNKLITEDQFQLENLKLENKYNDERDELTEQRKEAEQAQREIDLQNRLDAVSNDFFAEYELKNQQLQLERQKELEEADKTGADKALINAKYNKLEEDNNKVLQENKVELAKNTLGSLISILGENSKAGKAVAVMQTTIDTYQAAVSAYKSMSGIPIVGPALGAVAAAGAVAMGLSNVKKITSTKEPKLRTGGIPFSGIGGNLHSHGGTRFFGEDGSSFEAERGEGIGVLSRSAFGAFNAFNNAYTNRDNFSGSGMSQNSQLIDAIRSMPSPVVTVEDINTQQYRYISVVDYANI